MIEGLKFDFTSEELKKHYAKRNSHHNERAEFYKGQAEQLKAGKAEAMQYTNGDPIRSLTEKASEHEQRAELFEILYTHVVPGESYRLSKSDMQEIELIKGRY